MISEETKKRKEEIIKQLKVYFPKKSSRIINILDQITEEDELIRELDNFDLAINQYKSKYTNAYYSEPNYYANIDEDNRIYDPEDEIDKQILEEALEEATEKYLDIDPNEIHNEKEFSNFINVDVIHDEQIGYRVIENKNGLFHGIQKESSWYVYPSEKLDLNNQKNLDLLNELFYTQKKLPFNLGDELELNEVNAAEIFMPYVAFVDNPINQTTHADVLIGESITVDEHFKNQKIKNISKLGIKNKVTKGLIVVKEKNKNVGFQEDLILEPIKYIEGTFIPYPREKRENETLVDYDVYLKLHYASYGYEIKYDENNNPIYPHLFDKTTIENTIETQEKFEENFGFESFIKNKYGLESITNLEKSILLAHLKAYRTYLHTIKINSSETQKFVETHLEDTEKIIEGIRTDKLL